MKTVKTNVPSKSKLASNPSLKRSRINPATKSKDIGIYSKTLASKRGGTLEKSKNLGRTRSSVVNNRPVRSDNAGETTKRKTGQPAEARDYSSSLSQTRTKREEQVREGPNDIDHIISSMFDQSGPNNNQGINSNGSSTSHTRSRTASLLARYDANSCDRNAHEREEQIRSGFGEFDHDKPDNAGEVLQAIQKMSLSALKDFENKRYKACTSKYGKLLIFLKAEIESELKLSRDGKTNNYIHYQNIIADIMFRVAVAYEVMKRYTAARDMYRKLLVFYQLHRKEIMSNHRILYEEHGTQSLQYQVYQLNKRIGLISKREDSLESFLRTGDVKLHSETELFDWKSKIGSGKIFSNQSFDSFVDGYFDSTPDSGKFAVSRGYASYGSTTDTGMDDSSAPSSFLSSTASTLENFTSTLLSISCYPFGNILNLERAGKKHKDVMVPENYLLNYRTGLSDITSKSSSTYSGSSDYSGISEDSSIELIHIMDPMDENRVYQPLVHHRKYF